MAALQAQAASFQAKREAQIQADEAATDKKRSMSAHDGDLLYDIKLLCPGQ